MAIKKHPIRAVFDTNLFVSSLFSSHGSVAKLQQLWLSGAFELAVSEEILEEIGETLQKASIVTKDKYKTDRIVGRSR